MRTVFADTFYFIALLNPADAAHARALQFTAGNAVRMLTTEWVLTELADGLAKSSRGRIEFLATLVDLQPDDDVMIVPCDHTVMAEGVRLYGERSDKEWSLTDCISFVAMTKAGVADALTADHHFEQAGFVALLK
jgi:predicted nucleic acid-binding protein